ncbi:MAG: PspA/IM30 family protein [Acidobacteriia bacterium]|nr:PspA/IM30 family protein [Terriglobia bacterium]
MGIVNRVSIMVRAKVMGVVDRAEDPRETLSYACQRQEELLGAVRRSLVEVSASKHQLAAQISRLEQRVPQLDDQAARAVAASREDLARQALERRQLADRQLTDLRRQLDEVASEEQKLRQAERRFASAVEAFRARRDLLSARYTAAEAQYEAQRSLAGLSGELTDLGEGIHRAEEKIERMQARATAIDALLSTGALENLSGDQIEEELRRHTDQQEVTARLEELKQKHHKGDSV